MKLLLIVYKIEAGKGSEDGSGFDFVNLIPKEGYDIHLITRQNNIDKLKGKINPAIRLHAVDVPWVLSFYKKGERGIILYYYFWQYFVGRKIQSLRKDFEFDIIHQFNFHTDWAPHFIKKRNEKIILGPIMHHEQVPRDCLPFNQTSKVIQEFCKQMAKYYFWYLDPNLKSTVKRTDQIIYANRNYAAPFRKITKMEHVPLAGANHSFFSDLKLAKGFKIISVGRLVSLKGFELTVEAFKKFKEKNIESNVVLTIIGSGPLEKELNIYIKQHKLENCVEMISWIQRGELAQYYQDASVLLYPSWESQGLVVSEAMASGTVVISIENTGPAFLSEGTGISVSRGTRTEIVDHLCEAIGQLFEIYQNKPEAFLKMMELSQKRYFSYLSSDAVVKNILSIYDA